MTRNLILSFIALIFISTSTFAQKPKVKTNATKTTTSSSQQSNAEKMGYERANKYWGPGTYYRYAPGEPTYKMANTSLSDMRDLIGIWGEDFYKEIAKQGYAEVPKKEVKRWFNPNNNKEKRFFYSPDKSYILESGVRGLNESPEIDGHKPQVSTDACRIRLIAKEDTAQVMEAIWQYFRDLHNTKLILGSLASNFKKAELKVNPIQRVGTAGWAGLRAGSFVLMMENGKPKSIYQSFVDIIRRTIAKPEFDLRIMGAEQAFGYNLRNCLSPSLM